MVDSYLLRRRQFLQLAASTSALAVAGCAPANLPMPSSTKTVLELTKAQGYTLTYDKCRGLTGFSYVNSLSKEGKIVLEGDLYFTVGDNILLNNDSVVGSEISVLAEVPADSVITWHVWDGQSNLGAPIKGC